jgi:hypothetical protein
MGEEMMKTDQKIEPEKVTKPIQLLAAWLIGLILVNGTFLTAASLLENGSWERTALVIASIVNVPLFLVSMFLLQTRFRPELQEDIFYSQYLDKKTNQVVTLARDEKIEMELLSLRNQILVLSNPLDLSSNKEKRIQSTKETLLGTKWNIALNDYLDNFTEIRSFLKSEGIAISEIFGSTSTKNRPVRKQLTFSRSVDFKSKAQMILIASKFGFEAYNYYSPEEEESIVQEILIGSYGPASFPITPELIEVLKASPEPVDLMYYEQTKVKAEDIEQ